MGRTTTLTTSHPFVSRNNLVALHNYATIVKVATKLPEAVLQEDEKLLMYVDNAQTRLGDDA